ncbi:MAG: iron-containing alcohol dehydrogenase [Clostridia bacterium]|nr:iron-containing alcohol dehydrogenase [Clostridia bacterium]
MTHSIYMPVKCFWGKNCVIENADSLAIGKSCLIVTGKSSAKLSGALNDAVSALKKRNISYGIFDEIGENPLISVCHKAGEAARKINADFILGIGGGSVLDASKAIAIYAANPDLTPIDIYKRDYSCKPFPVALIGTTAGTGSEVTAVAVLTNDETGIKKSISGPDCYAAISFCDPKYTHSMSYKTTVSTALDAFAHAVEGFFTAKCNGVLRLFAEKCIPELYSCLEILSKTDKVPEEIRENLYYASIYAGLVINTCGTAFPHPLGYVLTENYGIPHGTACAAFFEPFIDRCAEFAPQKFADFCRMTDEINNVKITVASLTDLGETVIDKECAEKYALRWQSVIPRNFTASPGGLTIEEAARFLASI